MLQSMMITSVSDRAITYSFSKTFVSWSALPITRITNKIPKVPRISMQTHYIYLSKNINIKLAGFYEYKHMHLIKIYLTVPNFHDY